MQMKAADFPDVGDAHLAVGRSTALGRLRLGVLKSFFSLIITCRQVGHGLGHGTWFPGIQGSVGVSRAIGFADMPCQGQGTKVSMGAKWEHCGGSAGHCSSELCSQTRALRADTHLSLMLTPIPHRKAPGLGEGVGRRHQSEPLLSCPCPKLVPNFSLDPTRKARPCTSQGTRPGSP